MNKKQIRFLIKAVAVAITTEVLTIAFQNWLTEQLDKKK